jgi:hypothetical protein
MLPSAFPSAVSPGSMPTASDGVVVQAANVTAM